MSKQLLFLVFTTLLSCSVFAQTTRIIGQLPGEYIGQEATTTFLVEIQIEDRIIKSIKKIPTPDKEKIEELKKAENTIVLSSDEGKTFDVMYPGLIDLHNHTKQNNLPLWEDAKGQFANRFEWRAWTYYTKAVSHNMNPWIRYGRAIECAAFRWSELQAMVIGTTFLQGPSYCVDDFAIHRAESSNGGYLTEKLSIHAPTDIIYPDDMPVIWNVIRPRMLKLAGTEKYTEAIKKGVTYPDALKSLLIEYCPKLEGRIQSVLGDKELEILGKQKALKEACEVETKEDDKRFPHGFLRYVYKFHKSIAGKLNYLNDPRHSAFIVHLSEGRRNDPYNQLEFDIFRILGLDKPHVNIVHGVGLDGNDLKHLADKKMGLIWSPFSNLLLYGETIRLEQAIDAKVLMAIGSDWTPTGSKSVLEELRIARAYAQKVGLYKPGSDSGKLKDRDFYYMVTRNPAIMMNHYHDGKDPKEHGIGTLAVGAMGTLIAVSNQKDNPYSNLIDSVAGNINLVIVDGKPIYGNEDYVDQFKKGQEKEPVPSYMERMNEISSSEYPPPGDIKNRDATEDYLIQLGSAVRVRQFDFETECQFKETKVFVPRDSGEEIVEEYKASSGLNLDRFTDIQKLLGVNIMTQGYNASKHDKGDKEYKPPYFPSLFSCSDPIYQKRFSHFISADSDSDELTENLKARWKRRIEQKLGRTPEKLSEEYKLPTYDRSKDY
jgi:cytosine/adenosine deaminase-related metal-dependent hydrolase